MGLKVASAGKGCITTYKSNIVRSGDEEKRETETQRQTDRQTQTEREYGRDRVGRPEKPLQRKPPDQSP